MKTNERRVNAIEDRLHEQFHKTCFSELKNELNKKNPKWQIAFDEIKSLTENLHLYEPRDAGITADIKATKQFNQAVIAIFDHHLPECAARIREGISWL